jgi:hypothetical protein
MVSVMLAEVAFPMSPDKVARRARLIRSPVSCRSILLGAEERSRSLHERGQP